MLTPTRPNALAHARVELYRLSTRAQGVAGPAREYVQRLAESWDERLADLAQIASRTAVSDDVWRVLDRLTATVNDPTLTSDALIEWVDAYPEAIADLFAVAEARLDGPDAAIEMEPARARNKQPALALAA
ncbi:MAG TPA: hypothetical protein VLM76_09005 [Patescibacteria group bacterium]|nr:hypothetical protein [Patescibacteria group bacterium]